MSDLSDSTLGVPVASQSVMIGIEQAKRNEGTMLEPDHFAPAAPQCEASHYMGRCIYPTGHGGYHRAEQGPGGCYGAHSWRDSNPAVPVAPCLTMTGLSSGYIHVRAAGPCNWGQWRTWPPKPDELEDGFFPEASAEFRREVRRIMEERDEHYP